MTFENTFASIGRTLDGFTEAMKSFGELVGSLLPKRYEMSPWSNVRLLVEDVAENDYDLVERDGVRVRRDDDTAVCYYDDGSGFEEFARYDLMAVSES